MTHAQDPNERFDIVTFDGEQTGKQKRRGDVHRDGDWHASIHIWVVGQRDGDGFLLMQRRSLAKDTNPGLLDPTVSGHLGAGERWQDGLRESREEIGLAISPSDVVLAGIRRAVNERDGILDHEVQRVFFARNDAQLAIYRPNPVEIDELVQIRIDDALELMTGDKDQISTEVLDARTLATRPGTLDRAAFSDQLDRYVYRVAIAARLFLAGERHFSI